MAMFIKFEKYPYYNVKSVSSNRESAKKKKNPIIRFERLDNSVNREQIECNEHRGRR